MSFLHPPSGATMAPGNAIDLTVQAAPRVPVASVPLPKPVTPDGLESLARAMSQTTSSKLAGVFDRLDYDWDAVAKGSGAVPRIFLARLPKDMKSIREVKTRKALFFRAVLPLVLQVNEEILNQRRRLWRLRAEQKMGRRLDAIDRLWLIVMAERYGVKRGDIDGLLHRVDVISPSLALAQAAEESGWGTSRFVREGNAIFGQWTFSSTRGLTPRRRDDGKKHAVKAFDSLLDSARAYAFNLNTHRAYREYRQLRTQLRRDGAPVDGHALAGTLKRYSQRGEKYVDTIRALIAINKLRPLDDARLTKTGKPSI